MAVFVRFFDDAGTEITTGAEREWERFLSGAWSAMTPARPGWYLVVNYSQRVCGFAGLREIKGQMRMQRDLSARNLLNGQWQGWYWDEPLPDPMSVSFPFLPRFEPKANAGENGQSVDAKRIVHEAKVRFVPELMHEIPGRVAFEWGRFLSGHWTRTQPAENGLWIVSGREGCMTGQLFTFKVESGQESVFQRSALHAFEPATECWRWSEALPLYMPKRIVVHDRPPERHDGHVFADGLRRKPHLRVVPREGDQK